MSQNGKPVKLFVEKSTFEKHGYPTNHGVWKLFKDGSKVAVVEAEWRPIPAEYKKKYAGPATGVYTLKSGGSIMDDQAKAFPEGCDCMCDGCPDASRCPDPF